MHRPWSAVSPVWWARPCPGPQIWSGVSFNSLQMQCDIEEQIQTGFYLTMIKYFRVVFKLRVRHVSGKPPAVHLSLWFVCDVLSMLFTFANISDFRYTWLEKMVLRYTGQYPIALGVRKVNLKTSVMWVRSWMGQGEERRWGSELSRAEGIQTLQFKVRNCEF